MAQLKEIDKFSLSDGSSIRITKLGRYYNYARLYNSLETPPEVITRISKAKAYSLAEVELRQDVCESY